MGRPVGVRGGLGEAPGALREAILCEKVVFGNVVFFLGFAWGVRGLGRPVAAPCSSGAVRDVPRRLRNLLRGKADVRKNQEFRKMQQIFEFSIENGISYENWNFFPRPHLQNS